jgi:hypothetical protein
LFSLTERGFQRKDGTHPVPLINLVMSLKVAEWARRQLLEPSNEPVPVDPTDIDGRCELIDGTPVHPLLVAATTALFQLDAPTLRRYLFDADSRLLGVSVNARGFPEWQRTGHLVQSRGQCDTPGCDAPHNWLQIDPVDNGGKTEFRNGQPQCGADNGAKGASTGHTAWRDRPPPTSPTRRLPKRNTDRGSPDDANEF